MDMFKIQISITYSKVLIWTHSVRWSISRLHFLMNRCDLLWLQCGDHGSEACLLSCTYSFWQLQKPLRVELAVNSPSGLRSSLPYWEWTRLSCALSLSLSLSLSLPRSHTHILCCNLIDLVGTWPRFLAVALIQAFGPGGLNTGLCCTSPPRPQAAPQLCLLSSRLLWFLTHMQTLIFKTPSDFVTRPSSLARRTPPALCVIASVWSVLWLHLL